MSGNSQPLASKRGGVRGCRAGGPRLGLEWNAFSCRRVLSGNEPRRATLPSEALTSWIVTGGQMGQTDSMADRGSTDTLFAQPEDPRGKCRLGAREETSVSHSMGGVGYPCLTTFVQRRQAVLQEQSKRGRDSITRMRIPRPRARAPAISAVDKA